MKWLLIEATKTPNDSTIIDSVINGSCKDDTKYSPDIEFMKIAYEKLNELMFLNMLPSDMKFKIINAFDKYVGDTVVMRSSINGNRMLLPTTIVFNNSLTLTMRDWVNVMIHEMLHAYDVEYRSNEYSNPDYEKHGGWFVEQVNRINKKYGFDVQVQYDKKFGVNDEQPNLSVNHLVIIGKEDDVISGVIVSDNNKDEFLEYIYNELKKKSVLIMTTMNQDSDMLDKFNPKTCEYTIYECDDEFMHEFGPFVDAKTISLKRMFANESVDDEPEDIRILRQIKGIREIRKVKDGWEFHIS